MDSSHITLLWTMLHPGAFDGSNMDKRIALIGCWAMSTNQHLLQTLFIFRRMHLGAVEYKVLLTHDPCLSIHDLHITQNRTYLLTLISSSSLQNERRHCYALDTTSKSTQTILQPASRVEGVTEVSMM